MLLHYTLHTQFPSPSMLPSVEQSVHCDQQPSPTTRQIKRARHPQVINKEFTTYTHLSSSSHQQLSTVWLVTHSTEHLCITLWERVGYGVTYQWCTSIFISTINIKLPCNVPRELVISVGPTPSPYYPHTHHTALMNTENEIKKIFIFVDWYLIAKLPKSFILKIK